ncbi:MULTISPECIES: G5 domain-containing protein [Exiguobacterium]|uniref:VanW family protein n=2 Tax=Bacillales Family XII. Incertae Sedis TaxID=539742 RepID=A0ABT6R0M3_9BACL|nr:MULTISPECIES: G5 domain-containing protein [Exiguobacterium]MCT4778762.1 VanW family protein [Exiguobacterium soli]MDI3234489.1 VanW family protein [Exiguobacterium antarcticum]
MMINLKRFAVHTLLLVALIALIYVPSFALISFTGKATVAENFSETARIGSVPVSGLTRKEAKPKVQEAVTSWSKKTPLTVGTGEETLPIPTELVTFKIEDSIKAASLKKGGALQVIVDEAATEAYLATQPITYTDEQIKTFKTWLIKTSEKLEESNFDPAETAAAIDPAGEVVSSVTFMTRSAAEEQMIDAMAQVDIKAGQLMNVKTYGMDPVAASYIGSKLYELFAKTPFEIVERMPHAQLPDDLTLGYDVKIDDKTDFAVRNTQAVNYQVIATKNGSDVTLELRGTPFKETVTAVLEAEKMIPYRTITRYSATLSAGTSSDTQSGAEGKSIELYRVTKSNQGEVKQLLALDFYSATPAIVTKSSQEELPPVVTPPPADDPVDDSTDSTTEEDTTPNSDGMTDDSTDGTTNDGTTNDGTTTPDTPTTPDQPTAPDTPDAPTTGDPASPVEDDSTEGAVG